MLVLLLALSTEADRKTTGYFVKLDMPDGKLFILCKTCTKVTAVLVPIPPCLIFRTASQTGPTKNHNNKHII